jgi:hypothetical protein
VQGHGSQESKQEQQQLNVDEFKLLKKPMDHLGKSSTAGKVS